MTVRVGDELPSHDKDPDLYSIQHLFFALKMPSIVVNPVDKILDLMHKGVTADRHMRPNKKSREQQ